MHLALQSLNLGLVLSGAFHLIKAVPVSQAERCIQMSLGIIHALSGCFLQTPFSNFFFFLNHPLRDLDVLKKIKSEMQMHMVLNRENEAMHGVGGAEECQRRGVLFSLQFYRSCAM